MINVNKLLYFLSKNGLLAIFIIILLEYACFPMSAEVILPFAGNISYGNSTPFVLLYLVTLPASLLGTSICYLVGLLGGHKIINYITRHFPGTKKGFDYSYQFFSRHGNSAVCLGRLVPICRTYISFIAGATHQSFINFIIFSLFGISLWNGLLLGLGYFLGFKLIIGI